MHWCYNLFVPGTYAVILVTMSYLDLLLMTCMWGQSFILTHLKIIWYRDISDIYIPPHNASCLGASAVFAPVAGWKSTTSTSCNWWQPLPVQVKYLHKVQRTGCKVKRSGHNVQRLGPASALAGMGCSNNMQLQSPPPLNMQIWSTQHDAAITATCVRARFVGSMAGQWFHLNQLSVLQLLCIRY